MNKIVTFIDADTIPYIIGWNHQETQDVAIVLDHVDKFITTILDRTNCRAYMGFIGGTKCFRHEVAKHKPYKGQRGEDPEWYKLWAGPIKAWMRDHWGFMVVNGIEADDAVSVCQRHTENSVVASADKDVLKQIPGNKYNIKTAQFSHVTTEEAYQFLFTQMITGDSVDNIEGLKGKGPAFAKKLLTSDLAYNQMYDRVMKEYIHQHGEEYGRALFHETYQLVGLLTAPTYLFEIPEFIPYKETPVVESPPEANIDDLLNIWDQNFN